MTPYGVMERYVLTYSKRKGTILELADYIMVTMQTPEGATVPMTKAGWHEGDAAIMYDLLVACISDFDMVGAPIGDLSVAKDVLLRSVITDRIPEVAARFRQRYSDWNGVLTESPAHSEIIKELTDDSLGFLFYNITENDYPIACEMAKHEVFKYLMTHEK